MFWFSFILKMILLFAYSIEFQLTDEQKKVLNQMIESQVKKAHLHSFGVIVTNQDKTIFNKTYSEDDKINTQTPFIIGSVSKSFTTLGIYKLGIDINNTLDKYENLKDYIDEDFAKSTTVSELLNHTSGLESFGRHRVYEKGYWNYSNYGFALLGKIIESVSTKTYQEYMNEKVFIPLNLINTQAKYRKEIINSYEYFFGVRTKYMGLESEMDNVFYIPAGFISISIEDMGNYLRYYLKNYIEQTDEYKNYIFPMINKTVEIDYNVYYGSGMIVEKMKGGKIMFHHSGGTNSFLSHLYVYPESDLAFFMVTNTNDIFCSTPAMELFDNIKNFLLYDTIGGISTSLGFYIHFTLDIIFIFVISIPLAYLVITIVRRIKKKKYTWFFGIKGKMMFGIDILILIILPLFIIIALYTFNPDIAYSIDNVKDLKFVIFMSSSTLFLTFIIKLVYVFIYNKYFKTFDLDSTKKLGSVDLDYMPVEEEN